MMRANGSRPESPPVGTAEKQAKAVFARMSHYLGQLGKGSKRENVHRFRTNSRRVEALVSELAPESKNKRKLLKLLSQLRKKAGRVRDLDVQIAFLKELRVSDRQNHRAQLLQALVEEQAQRSKKLAKHCDREKIRELRERLERVEPQLALEGIDPLRLAMNRLPKPGPMPLSQKVLHAYRIAAKQARYLAELAQGSPRAELFIAELKRAQDEIGQWHDLLKLTERAQALFGGVHDSPLVSLLENLTRARFKRAGMALITALKTITGLEQSRLPGQKPDASASQAERAQVAVA
jgi:CHAD domain-containing protein